MKFSRTLAVLVTSLLVLGTGIATAEDVVPTRAEQVALIHAKYDPLFDAQYARLMAVKSKITYNASMLSSFKFVMTDFLGVRKFIDTSLLSSTSELETVISYAEEELGEFTNTLYLLETQIAKSKTITCVKGKTTKKVMAYKPVCPKGFVKK